MPSVRHAGRIFVFCALLLGAAASFAAPDVPVDADGLPLWVAREWTDAPVRLELRDLAELDRLLATVPLADFHREDLRFEGEAKSRTVVLETRVTDAEFAALTAAGWRPERLRDREREARAAVERAWAETAGKAATATSFPLTAYPTHAEIGTILTDLAAAHPAIARTFTWGTSVQGRELWGIVISDDVNIDGAEPEVRLSSTMHGDEVVDMVMLINLAEYLTTNYGQPGYDDVTALVDGYEIHIMPLNNPDGMVAGSRYNADGVDLNRNFLVPAGTQSVLAVENQQFMDYALGHHFVISQNGHGGALLVNYPWDYTPIRAPDDAALIKLSLEYSTTNLPMYNGSFPQGITNGYDWYVAYGSLQDWVYDQTDCIDLTIEVSNTKWPQASTLAGYWDDNRQSLLNFVKAARYGVNGVVTASDSGLPLDALVTVTGNAMTVRTDPDNGDYYKLLDTGSYDLTFSADGYVTRTVSDVATVWGTPTVLDVTLDPAASGDLAGAVYGPGGAPVVAAVDIATHPLNAPVASTVSDAGDGTYGFTGLTYGDYELTYTAEGYAKVEQVVTLDAASVTAPDVTLVPARTITPLFTDFETQSTAGWTTAWAAEAGGADGTDYAVSDSPGSNYDHNTDSPCAMTAGADLSEMNSGTVSFWAKWSIESEWDGVTFEVSTDGGSDWTRLAAPYTGPGSGKGVQISGEPYFDGVQTQWVFIETDLAPWLGQADVRFRFVLASDTAVAADGFRFDEFLITGEGDTLTSSGDVPAATRIEGLSPNPFNPSTRIDFSLARDGHARVDVFDVTGRRVRTLIDETLSAGPHDTAWNGRTDGGSRAASGLYFVRLRSGGVSETAKALLVK